VKLILETLNDLNIWSTVFRIFLSVLLGGLIGLERGHHGRAAGLRTHILVCLGSSLAALIGVYSVKTLELGGDPMRVAAQVVSGIGFLGVGTIMIRNHQQVTGLTTAAGLWATARIGLAVGIGLYVAAFAAFFAVVITMAVFIYLERSVKSKVTYTCYIEIDDIKTLNEICDRIREYTSNIDLIPAKSGIANHVGVEFKADSIAQYDSIINIIEQSEAVAVVFPLQS
jgi:putative Mg2+ transporter-C (MgtC) family protein